MSATPQNPDDQELDLSQISRKIGHFFEGISNRIFKGILFFKRNIVWIGILFVVGAGLGFYLDKNTKIYDNQIIVSPNFGSTDDMYAKIELINSKIGEGDTIFLKNVVGVKEPKKLRGIEVSPITDVYKFVENKAQNFELIKLMAEDGDIEKVIKESITSKNYPYHLIEFSTVDLTSNEATVKPILDYLNSSDYYKKIQKEFVNNVKVKMVENDSVIGQINGFLNTFNSTVNGSQKSDKLVYYNENSQLDAVIKTKDLLVNEQGSHRLELVSLDKIVKDKSVTLNVKNNKKMNGKKKIILPFLFIFLFVSVNYFKSYYQKQLAKFNA
jgi:small nuclear ribonucleoprotein (snRNP)-like protein